MSVQVLPSFLGYDGAKDSDEVNMKKNFKNPLFAALAMGVICTLGDFLWAWWQIPHKTVYGIVHGALMCVCVGAILGFLAGGGRAALIGAGLCLSAGILISAAFYPLYEWIGNGAMFLCWMLLWLAFALVHRRLVGSGESLGRVSVRGLLTALTSASGFYPVYLLWTNPPDGDYYLFLAAWTVAFLPGFFCLMVGHQSGGVDKNI